MSDEQHPFDWDHAEGLANCIDDLRRIARKRKNPRPLTEDERLMMLDIAKYLYLVRLYVGHSQDALDTLR